MYVPSFVDYVCVRIFNFYCISLMELFDVNLFRIFFTKVTFVIFTKKNVCSGFFCGPGAGLVILELILPVHILKRATR